MSKNFFQQKPVELKPKELVPDGINLNSLTDSIVASKAINDAERQKNLEELNKREYDLAVKCARAEIAEEEENARKQRKREEAARLRAEEVNQLSIGRQLRLKKRLAELTAECSSAKSLLDAIDDKDALEIAIFKATIAALNKTLNT